MRRPEQPCLKDCPKRSPDCRSICIRWAIYKYALKKFYQERGELSEQAQILYNIERDRKRDIATGRMRRRKSKK